MGLLLMWMGGWGVCKDGDGGLGGIEREVKDLGA
jgi:hypothetical protein